jgi:hypothetical protein
VREKYCWLVAGGWFVLREKYCWLVADKPNEQVAAAIEPQQWVLAQQEATRLERNTSGPAAAPSPKAAHQRATKHWWSHSKVDRALVYQSSNGAAFVVAMSLLLVLLIVRGTSTASCVASIVGYTMPVLFFTV